jgi:hypothetical protein
MRYCYQTDKGTYFSDDPPEMVGLPSYWEGLYASRTRIPVPRDQWPTEIVSVKDSLADNGTVKI